MLAVAIILGLHVRTGAFLTLVPIALKLEGADNPAMLALATHALDALALAMVGPGAFSVDARIFGRSTISLRH